MVLVGIVVLTPLMVSESLGLEDSWPGWGESVLGRTAQVLMLGGLALAPLCCCSYSRASSCRPVCGTERFSGCVLPPHRHATTTYPRRRQRPG